MKDKLFTLHYADKSLSDGIKAFPDLTKDTLMEMVLDITCEPTDIVWLVAFNDQLYITDHSLMIEMYIVEHALTWVQVEDGERAIFLQEFVSYEEAYTVGLAMHEPNPLCYEHNPNLN